MTLTYSDATLLEGLIGAPFLLAGADPLVVANSLMLLAFPACGLAFFYAAWRLTGEPDAALIAGLVGAWYPFHAEHYSHLELQWVMFVPLAIVAGLRLLADPRAATGVRFGAAVTAQWLASMYLGVMLLSLLMAAGLQGAAVIATDAVISIGIGFAKVSVFGLAGAIGAKEIAIALLMGAMAFPGAFLARALVEHLSVRMHTALLDAVVLAGGAVMLYGAATR